LNPLTFRLSKVGVILAKLADPVELEDDHEPRNRDVYKVPPPVDNYFILGHHFERTNGLHNPQQGGLGRIITPRIGGSDEGFRSARRYVVVMLAPLREPH